uniref:DNA mismatch repair proteins mutS family domain-containing protein n=1 Tax=Rhodosorus marinus TaxID=101924 RepID=A0A7S3ENA7_9RHOD|mmetsp:Transcript_8093/g.35941  ORF Transcript_8093/g.35941 Transcript_8093/m.35941 type:complete len:741 (+) Transcript_8093:123-2345(+)
MQVHTGQTIEGVIARLQSGMYAAPIYLHESLYGGSSLGSRKTTSSEVDSILRVAASFQNEAGGVEGFSSPDAVGGLLDSVSLNLRLDREGFTKITKRHTTRPLYFSTASQLGVHRTRGVPDLVGQVAGRDAPALARQWIRKQLLLPPPPSISAQLRNASLFLLNHLEPLPDFPTIAKHQVAQLVRSKEANEVFFRELRDACQAIYTAGSNDKTKDFIQALTASAGMEIGLELDLVDVLSTCEAAIQLIEDTIIVEPRSDLDETSEQFPDDKRYLFSLRKSNEGFVGKVHTAKFEKEWERVEAARVAVGVAAEELLQLGEEIKKERKLGDSKKDAVGMSFDLFNNAVWLRLPSGQNLVHPLIHPKDRNGMVVSNRFSTDKLEAALDEYRLCCSECANAVRDQLRHLSTSLEGESLPPLVGACVLATIASAMVHHVTHAGILNGWNPASERGSDRSIVLRQFWPYWLDGRANSTVTNSIDLDSLVILSGPNMAGKSTVLRSVCSIALLATCGFLVPAKEASVPFVDYIMLRTFSSDSPAEGKSGFAVEMHEMRSVLEDATENSLVLVDELGKGTEMTAGAALAGSILEALDRSGCYGIFATHLHALFDMELDAPNMKEMMMCSEKEEGRVRPTLKVAAGRSLESLAMTVARDCGMPSSVVHRAEELLGRLRDRRNLGKVADGASKANPAFSSAKAAAPDHRVPLDLQGAELVLRSVVSHSLSCEPVRAVTRNPQKAPLAFVG